MVEDRGKGGKAVQAVRRTLYRAVIRDCFAAVLPVLPVLPVSPLSSPSPPGAAGLTPERSRS